MGLSGLTGFLDCADPNIVLTASTCNFADMPLLGNANSEFDPFIFEVSPSCPAGSDIEFNLTVTDINDSTYTFDFILTCEAGEDDSFELIESNEQHSFELMSTPNPFNPVSEISFKLENPGFTQLKVYDAAGREAAVLVNSSLPAGQHRFTFNGSSLSSGLYFFRLNHDGNEAIIKSLLIK